MRWKAIAFMNGGSKALNNTKETKFGSKCSKYAVVGSNMQKMQIY